MADGIVLGLNAVTAENTGTTAAPVWVTLVNVKDETLNMETALSDVTNRAANGWRLQVGTLSEASVDTQMIYQAGSDVAQAEFANIRDAFLDKSRILMGFFDDDPAAASTTVNGLIGGFGVTNFSIGRQLEEAMMVDVTFTAREDDAGNGPQWLTITNP
jgi:hypothetical protein